MHPILVGSLVPGIPALIYWCKRYVPPAIKAFKPSNPVVIQDRTLVILGREYPIDEDTVLRFDSSVLALWQGKKHVVSVPSFFIRIRA